MRNPTMPWMNVLPPSSGSKRKPSKKSARSGQQAEPGQLTL
jgi:hypothetical protein